MAFSMGIEMASCCCASIRQISELMDMDPVFLVGVESSHYCSQLRRLCNCVLTEGNHSMNFRVVRVEDADCMPCVLFGCYVDRLFLFELDESRDGQQAGQCEFSYHNNIRLCRSSKC